MKKCVTVEEVQEVQEVGVSPIMEKLQKEKGTSELVESKKNKQKSSYSKKKLVSYVVKPLIRIIGKSLDGKRVVYLPGKNYELTKEQYNKFTESNFGMKLIKTIEK